MTRPLRKRWVALGALASLGVAAWLLRPPSAGDILASLDVPPAPVLSPDEALAAFRVAPGFRVELVAAEPLVVDPVAMDWDDEGRLYVVEMRGFMPDIDGAGEERPSGRVVVLEDEDGDGRMDRSDVFLDGLVLPRAVAVLPQGVLVGAPPDLWLCRDAVAATPRDRHCDDRVRLGDYATSGPNPEHLENGLLPAIDGWIYNAKSRRRFRFGADGFEVGATAFRGQFGIAQDDEGRLFYDHNSAFLYADAFPAEYPLRQPATAGRLAKPGVGVDLAPGAEVFGVRVAPGLNRAYTDGSLRADGRQRGPTGVSGIAIQRGDQYGPEHVGDAFVPEAAGAVVAQFRVERDDGREAAVGLRAMHVLHPDPQWGEREWLASTDERFRPVDAKVGPDGAIWVVDMYRGVIQHAYYVSDYLRAYALAHGLEAPGAQGRIWRVVREDRPIARRPPPLATRAQQLAALEHPNGWVRDRAQRRLAVDPSPDASAALRALDRFGPRARLHALWALAQRGALDATTWARALDDADPAVRRAALRAGEPQLATWGGDARARVLARLDDGDASVRLQALHTLGALPRDALPLAAMLDAARKGDALTVQAVVSGLGGREREALAHELEREALAHELEREALAHELEREALEVEPPRATASPPDDGALALASELAAAAHLAAQAGDDAARDVAALLDLAARAPNDALRAAVIEGMADAQSREGSRRVELAAPHALFDDGAAARAPVRVRDAIARLRPHITWPGDPRPGGARALTAEEESLRERGAALFAASCASCHGENGAGLPGLAPSLVGSPWVRDADAWLVRIALHGLTGPVEIGGETWRSTMPGHARDPRFDDEGLAGVATFLRRAFGHADDPVSPATVAAVRAETRERSAPWTVDELLALPVAHRLDRYAGTWRVPIVGLEILVRREGAKLVVGRPGDAAAPLDEIGTGAFAAPEISIRFEADDAGAIVAARLDAQGRSVPLSRAE